MMASPLSPILQRLHRLDTTSSNFDLQLCNVLYEQDYVQSVPNLEANDRVWLIDYLDEVLNGLDPSGGASRKCLRELRSICGAWGILPTSYTLSSQRVDISSDPFASGGFGDVYHGTLNGSRVCIKRLRMYTKDASTEVMKAFYEEAVTWKRLVHPNILPLLGVAIVPRVQLVSSWISGGDLPEYIEKHPDSDRISLLSGVAKGLQYLHSCAVIHGDLKGPNILVDELGSAHIADFGLAIVAKSLGSMSSTSYNHGLTPQWCAPEVLNEGKYSKEADIFSFAMVMVEVFTGAVPYSGSTNFMAMLHITQGTRPPRPTHPMFTEKIWSLMQRCWAHDPESRPEASEVLELLLTPDIPAWKRLITQTFTADERISLIKEIFLDRDQTKMVKNLLGSDAQAFIDRITEVLDRLEPQIHRKCLRYLSGICGDQALLPRSLEIPPCYDPTEDPVSRGRVADVWKGQHGGQKVAVQVFRLLPGDDTQQIKRRFCKEIVIWRALNHQNVLPLSGVTVTESRLVMVSEWMSRGSIRKFIQEDTNADRLELLRGTAKGLIYMHNLGIIHGDLRGVNILIDNNGNARLTGFSQVKVPSEQLTMKMPPPAGGIVPWTSPELLVPENFGLKESLPTKESDCYALGMVVYEVLSGRGPFETHRDLQVVHMVLDGVRPERPNGNEGVLFTDEIWGMLELCWKSQPGDRPSAKRILADLGGNQSPSDSTSDIDGDTETGTGVHLDVQQDITVPSTTRGGDERAAPPQARKPKGRWTTALLRRVKRMFGYL